MAIAQRKKGQMERRFGRLELYFGVGMGLLLIAMATGFMLRYAHQQVEQRIAASSQNLAKNVQQSIDQVVDMVSVSMLSATDEIARERASRNFNPVNTMMQLVLVEDNEINQLVASELLHSVGLQVEVADNGQVGVNQVHARQLEGQPYDLVLMDMQMPVMDGVTATRLIREIHSAEALPIVAMTANAMQVDKERCLAAGMNGFVSKPIDPESLWQALLASIKPRPGLGSSAPVHDLAEAQPATAQPQRQQELLHALRTLDGLDVDRGLRLCNQSASLYLSLLAKFVKSQAAAIQHIRQALADADGSTAERLAHTLKGLAASLGAEPLQRSAAELEAALHAETLEAHLEPLLVRTQAQLDALVAGLRAAPGLTQEPAHLAKGQPPEPAKVQRVVQILQHMLEQDDSEAVSLWEEHAPELHALLVQAPELEEAIYGFEFEEALRLLQVNV